MNEAVRLLQLVPDPVWNWGPAVFILVGVYALVIRGLRAVDAVAAVGLKKFLASQEKQAEAMTRLAICIEAGRQEDHLEYKEILLNLRIQAGEIRDIGKRIKMIQEERYGT
jgi:hypothetical protein